MRSPSQMCRTAASVSGSKTSSTEWAISRQARDPLASNAASLIDSNSAALIAPGTRGQHRPHRGQPAQRVAIARLGHTRFAAATRRSPVLRTELLAASASNVSAVWFSVPSPGETTTSTGAARSRARSRSVTPSAPSSTSSPPAPSTRVSLRRSTERPTPPARHASAAPCPPARPPRRAPAVRDSATSRQRAHPGQPRHLGEVVVAVGRRSARVCTPRRRCRPAGRGRPAPRWRWSCRRRCRCR